MLVMLVMGGDQAGVAYWYSRHWEGWSASRSMSSLLVFITVLVWSSVGLVLVEGSSRPNQLAKKNTHTINCSCCITIQSWVNLNDIQPELDFVFVLLLFTFFCSDICSQTVSRTMGELLRRGGCLHLSQRIVHLELGLEANGGLNLIGSELKIQKTIYQLRIQPLNTA